MPAFNHSTPPHDPWRMYPLAAGLSTLLVFTGGWLGSQAIAPTMMQASPTRVDVTLDVLENETFDLLLRRAEAVARAATQRSFDREILITEVNVVIAARKGDNLAPILSLQVTRENWRDRPDPRVWSTYYRTSRRLLNLESPKR